MDQAAQVFEVLSVSGPWASRKTPGKVLAYVVVRVRFGPFPSAGAGVA